MDRGSGDFDPVNHKPPSPPSVFVGFNDDLDSIDMNGEIYIRLSQCESIPTVVVSSQEAAVPKVPEKPVDIPRASPPVTKSVPRTSSTYSGKPAYRGNNWSIIFR